MRLKEIRTENSMKQAELALHFNVNTRTIRKWENEESSPTINQLIEIANYFNVSIDYLVGNDDVPNRKES